MSTLTQVDQDYPIDIFAIKKYGLERWQSGFFWPVSDREVEKIFGDLERCWLDHIRTQPSETGDLLLIQFKNLYQLTAFFHAVKVEQKLRQAGRVPLCTDNTLLYREILRDHFSVPVPLNPDWKEKVKDQLRVGVRTVRKLWNYNQPWSKIFGGSETVHIYGHPFPFIREYLAQWRGLIIPVGDFFPSQLTAMTLSADEKKTLEALAVQIGHDFIRIARNNDITLTANAEKYIVDFLTCSLDESLKMIHLAGRRLSGKPIHLLTNSFTDKFMGALALMTRKNGGRVTTFVHGGNMGLYKAPSCRWLNFLLSDELVTYSLASAGLFNTLEGLFPPSGNKQLKNIDFPSHEFEPLWQKHRKQPPAEKIKTVMLVGFPMNQVRYVSIPHGTFAPMQLDLELRLVQTLKKGGYRIIYKAHPDRIEEVRGIFEKDVEFITENFENVLDQADAFLFGDMSTSALNFALCTNKPVLLVCPGPEDGFLPEPYALFKKRCRVIDAHFDERNRILYDEKDILTILSRKPENQNHEFVKTYLLPGDTD